MRAEQMLANAMDRSRYQAGVVCLGKQSRRSLLECAFSSGAGLERWGFSYPLWRSHRRFNIII